MPFKDRMGPGRKGLVDATLETNMFNVVYSDSSCSSCTIIKQSTKIPTTCSTGLVTERFFVENAELSNLDEIDIKKTSQLQIHSSTNEINVKTKGDVEKSNDESGKDLKSSRKTKPKKKRKRESVSNQRPSDAVINRVTQVDLAERSNGQIIDNGNTPNSSPKVANYQTAQSSEKPHSPLNETNISDRETKAKRHKSHYNTGQKQAWEQKSVPNQNDSAVSIKGTTGFELVYVPLITFILTALRQLVHKKMVCKANHVKDSLLILLSECVIPR